MDNIQNEPLRLKARQKAVHELLLRKQNGDYPLADWYLGALYALNSYHNPDRLSQAAQSIRELLEKLPRISSAEDVPSHTGYALKQKREELDARLREDKELVEGAWKGKLISPHMDKTLRELEKYLEWNRRPRSSKVSFKSISDTDPIAGVFSKEIVKRKWQRFIDTWQKLQNYAHHKSKISEENIKEVITTCEEIILEAFALATAEDQSEIHNIITSENPTESDMQKISQLINKKGANYVYFWNNLSSSKWFPFLKKHGYFNSPPNIESAGDGYVKTPTWHPLKYLSKILNNCPDDVIELICNLKDTDNPRVMHEVAEMALAFEDIEHSLKLYKWITKYIQADYNRIAYESVIQLLQRWGSQNANSRKFAIKLTKKIVFFRPDPDTEKKLNRQREVSSDEIFSGDTIEPKPICDDWEYQEILEKGVRCVAEYLPLETAQILARATSNFLELSYPKEIKKSYDCSESWCDRVDYNDRTYKNAENELINTLTFVCELIYKKQSEKIVKLDKVLRTTNWLIFKRIRQHLYAKFPDKVPKEWIQEFIREDNRNFGKKDHHYEFQRMLRIACETHGNELFEEGELQGYLELILEGPEDEQEFVEYYKSWRGEAPPEGAFEQRRKYFHRSQLHPFAAVLYGKYNDYYETLENKSDQKEITDDDYYPTPSRVRSGTVVFRSPKSTQEMETVSDEDLFQFLEEWNDPKNVISVDEDDVYINHDALSATFKQHFLNVISKDAKRVRWWLEKTKLFSRPIFCKAIVDALSELISSKQHSQIKDFFDFCEWILSHKDTVPQTGWHEDREDADPDRPSWSSSRSAVRSFAARCISENAGLSQDWRERIFALYRELCTGKNAYLDGKDNNKNKRSGRDLISTAINNTRSQALEDLLRYADWVRKAAGKNCEVSEVVNVIEARLAGNPPLTDAERALLAMHFDNLRWLDAEWTKTHVPDIFDRKDPKLWQACFSAYITHSRGYLNDFDHLKPEYLHALRTVTLDGESDENGHERDSYVILKWMGYRLLIFYLWEKIEMKDSSNLCLELFYEATQRKKELWGDLFNHIGNSLTRWGSDVDGKVIERVKQLFEWRFEQAEPKELSDYLSWLGGKCLEPEWRMDGLLRTLPFLDDEDVKASMITDALHKHFLESHPEKTVECFAKVIEAAVKKPYFYIRKESAIPILKTGLVSQNTKTKAFAEEARENLLKAGLFEYLHL